MTFAAPYFLLGTLFALMIGALLLFGSVGLRRAVRRFGEPERVYSLQTADPSKRRAYNSTKRDPGACPPSLIQVRKMARTATQ